MAKEKLKAVLAEGKTPTYARTDDVAQQLEPILTLATQVQMQAAEHRQRLFHAQIEDPTNDGHLERLHQTLGAIDTDVKALIDAAQRVRQGFLQYDRYTKDIEKAVADQL